jgi:hypothetical protein
LSSEDLSEKLLRKADDKTEVAEMRIRQEMNRSGVIANTLLKVVEEQMQKADLTEDNLVVRKARHKIQELVISEAKDKIQQEINRFGGTADSLATVVEEQVKRSGLTEDSSVVRQARLQIKKLITSEAEETIRQEMDRSGVTAGSLSTVIEEQVRKVGLTEGSLVFDKQGYNLSI